MQVQQEALQLAQTQLDQDQQRVQIGTLAALSVQQDQSQVAHQPGQFDCRAEHARHGSKHLEKPAHRRLFQVGMTRTSSRSATLAAPMQLFDLQDSWNKGMTERPDLLQAQLNVEQQGIQLKFYRNQLFPELDLIGSYGYNGAGTGIQRRVQPVRSRQPAVLQLRRANDGSARQPRPAQPIQVRQGDTATDRAATQTARTKCHGGN